MQYKSLLGYYWKTNQNIVPAAYICMIFTMYNVWVDIQFRQMCFSTYT